MRFVFIFLSIFLLKQIHCNDSESNEINRIEVMPYYDTIVFSDVVDIINELNRNSQFNAFINSDSESDENVEDLLSEYQHYLDKAHEQRRNYLEKTNKTKIKVPLIRRDNFVRTNFPTTFQKSKNDFYNGNNYYNPGIYKFPPTGFGSPLDLFIPINPPFSYNLNKLDHETIAARNRYDGELSNTDKIIDDKKPFGLPLPIKKTNELIKSPCVCLPSTTPCKCNCNQCVMAPHPVLKSIAPGFKTEINRKYIPQNTLFADPRVQEHLLEDMNNAANTVNVKINVDIQLPKMLTGKQSNRESAVEYDDDNSRELTSDIRLPTTSFNFPIPIDMLGYRKSPKINRHDKPFRRITIHKKKKSRPNTNSNKRHRKKVISFHNFKLSPTPTLKPIIKGQHNTSTMNQTIKTSNETLFMTTPTENITLVTSKTNKTEGTTPNPDVSNNSTQFEEGIFFMVNISHNNENEGDEAPKTGNSIELDFKTKPNVSASSNKREKRDLQVVAKVKVEKNNTNNITKPIYITPTQKSIVTNDHKLINKSKSPEKGWFSDAELLYWPSNTPTNVSVVKPKNITDIILEREHKKAKLNLTKETIRHNRTKALEQAIFGQADWNDIDTVAPTFISFVGKYINGIITFCSSNICHSMKCAKKTCIHRTCVPDDRYNHIGHCSGSNKTDSVVSMESIMDLPSNLAFEIVDILQDKMLGKLHGKVTLCISLKCITFAASKKKFMKAKCISKDVDEAGHCVSAKKL